MPPQLPDLDVRVRALRRDLDRKVGEARALASRGKRLVEEVAALTALKVDLEKATAVLTSIGEQKQREAQIKIEALVTHGLRTIFGEDLSFHLVQSVSRSTAQVDFIVRSTLTDGSTVDTPIMEARGGGLAAVVGFLLRLVVLLLSPQRQDPVLVLDETFAMLSAEYVPRMAQFLRELVDRTSAQIILVTHQSEFLEAADVSYRFALVDGVTKVTAC